MNKNNLKTLRYYTTQSGKIPFLEWLNGLTNIQTKLRIRRRLDRLELGHYGDCESVGNDVFELRLFFEGGIRIYFAKYDNSIIILLNAGNKSSQKRDIKSAKEYWKDLQERSNEQK